MVLVDNFNRPVTNLRISLTPRCNLRCIYCHAEGEVAPRNEMTIDEITEVMQVGAEFGMKDVKFTGGEPTVRSDLVEIIRAVPGGMKSSLTTNGTLLSRLAPELKEAGLSRVNVSIDSLDRERYCRITGRDLLPDVIEGIRAAVDAGLTPVKLNVVVLKDINEDEIQDFIDFVKNDRDLILQLIELMDFKECPYHSDVGALEEELAARSRTIITRRMHHRKKYCLDGSEVEVVRPLHNSEFCAFCNRLRVTSDGHLKPCLLRHDNHVDIRGRHGDELRALFQEAVSRRQPYYY
jgi:cyclic pyranopterin phosphate synthase